MVVAGGTRTSWAALPAQVRAAIEDRLGFPVAVARDMAGGFTPGVAAAVGSTSGDRAFVKAISADLTPGGPEIYRREAAVTTALPSSAPVPRLLWAEPDLADGWVVLAFEHVDGRPPDLRRSSDLSCVLDTLTGLAATLDPSPVPGLPTFVDGWGDDLDQWTALAAAGPDALPGYPPWVLHAGPALADLAARWRDVGRGTALLHGDLRADNMLITEREDDAPAVVVVDWPEACVGAPWTDLVTALPSFALEGVDPEAVVTEHPLSRDVPRDDVDALLSGLAGFFVGRSLLPPPQGLPTVRAFQRAQAGAALAWLARRRPGLGGSSA